MYHRFFKNRYFNRLKVLRRDKDKAYDGITFISQNKDEYLFVNSELENGYVTRFKYDYNNHRVTNKDIWLKNIKYPCGSDKSHRGTVLTNEEHDDGYVYEIDPFVKLSKRLTSFGKFSHENSIPVPSDESPIGYIYLLTEDADANGSLRKFVPDDSTMDTGSLYIMRMTSNNYLTDKDTFKWIKSELRDDGTNIPKLEGVTYCKKNNVVYASASGVGGHTSSLYKIDLQKFTIERYIKGGTIENNDIYSSFDQVDVNDDGIVFLCEDKGNSKFFAVDENRNIKILIKARNDKGEFTGVCMHPMQDRLFLSYQRGDDIVELSKFTVNFKISFDTNTPKSIVSHKAINRDMNKIYQSINVSVDQKIIGMTEYWTYVPFSNLLDKVLISQTGNIDIDTVNNRIRGSKINYLYYFPIGIILFNNHIMISDKRHIRIKKGNNTLKIDISNYNSKNIYAFGNLITYNTEGLKVVTIKQISDREVIFHIFSEVDTIETFNFIIIIRGI
jgi:hypothetical protein